MGRFALKLPDMGEGTTEAELVSWHIRVGDTISEDQHIVDVMTDKATVEIPSPVSGTVVSIVGEPGQILPVGTEILVVDTATGEDPTRSGTQAVPSFGRTPLSREVSPRAAVPSNCSVGAAAPRPLTTKPTSPDDEAGRPLASPAVRRRALEMGVALRLVPGSGPAGRITQGDLSAYTLTREAPSSQQSPETANERAGRRRHGVEEVKIIGLRRVISERMQETKRRVPHFSYIEEVDVTSLEDVRSQLNGNWPNRPKLNILPFLAIAMARSVVAFPSVNARFDDENGVLCCENAVHLGIATQTPAGLVVPVIKHVEALCPWQIAEQIARLAQSAREGKASKETLSGSTITITSLGPLGGLATTPVINLPEVAIVGVNKIVERPAVIDGRIRIRKMMNLSSSFDHRVIDGWIGAEFVQAIKRQLERPAGLLSD